MRNICLSFFTGAGGLDIGLRNSGFDILFACEKDKDARNTIITNGLHKVVNEDVFSCTAESVREESGVGSDEVHLMVSGAPCQSFSTAGKRLSLDDPRGSCLLKSLELTRSIEPRYSIIENVRGILSASVDGKKGGVIDLVRELCPEMGYDVDIGLYNTADYGVPQKRERVLIIMAKKGVPMPSLTPTHADPSTLSSLPPWRTLRDAIGDIDGDIGECAKYSPNRAKWFAKLSEGQDWRNLSPEDQKAAMGNSLLSGGGRTSYFKRLWWDRPSPTLVTSPTQKATGLCHPSAVRPLSIREYKRIQQFPDDWTLCGSLVSQYKQVGNAVPVGFGEAIGKAVIECLVP
jgi:DNA (cytosine-5)-methyltransferase 1